MKKAIKYFLIIFAIIFVLVLDSLITRFVIIRMESLDLKGGGIVDMVTQINRERGTYEIPPLTENAKLDESAQAKCNDMAAKKYFDHNAPDGTTPWSFFEKAGYKYLCAGENITSVRGDSLAMAAFMASPEHKDNILNPDFTNVGIGRCSTDGWNYVIVQHFGTPLNSK